MPLLLFFVDDKLNEMVATSPKGLRSNHSQVFKI